MQKGLLGLNCENVGRTNCQSVCTVRLSDSVLFVGFTCKKDVRVES